MSIEYTQDIYNDIVVAKKYNEELIEELYGAYATMTFNEKLIAMDVVDYLKSLNDEYDKYIIAYQRKIKEDRSQDEYIVVEGDTLPRISQMFTGSPDNWVKLFEYNELSDMVLTPGDTIKVPRTL